MAAKSLGIKIVKKIKLEEGDGGRVQASKARYKGCFWCICVVLGGGLRESETCSHLLCSKWWTCPPFTPHVSTVNTTCIHTSCFRFRASSSSPLQTVRSHHVLSSQHATTLFPPMISGHLGMNVLCPSFCFGPFLSVLIRLVHV